MNNLLIQDRINQEIKKILQALQQLEIFLRINRMSCIKTH
jgi:hypothetical protein